MTQLLLVKSANTELKEAGDVIGVFKGTHEFSATEKETYDIVTVAGTVDEVKKALNVALPQKEVWKAETEKWSTVEPAQSIATYNSEDETWYFLEEDSVKFHFNYALLDDDDKKSLEESIIGKEKLFSKMVKRAKIFGTNKIDLVEE